MNLTRDKAAPPLYIQLFQQLMERIESNVYPTGSIIPSEALLEKEFNVSRMTVRLAIGELVNMGYVERMRGVGTIVTYGKIVENLKGIISFSEEMAQHGATMTTKYCRIEKTEAPLLAAQNLGIDLYSDVYLLKRLRCANDKPLVYSLTYLNIPNLPLDKSVYEDSLYKFLKTDFEIIMAKGQDFLEATLAEGDIAQYLELPKGFPVFKRTRIAADQNNKVLEYTVCYYPGDKYKYSVSL